MEINPFARALSLAGFDEFAASKGLDPSHMLRCAALPLTTLRRSEDIISYRRYCALLELCQQHSNSDLFGLEYGLYQSVNVLGDLFLLINNSKTIGDALNDLCSTYGRFNGSARIAIDIVEDLVFLSFHTSELTLTGLPQAEELACGVGLQLMRTFAGGGWQPSAVLLRHPPLVDETIYRLTLGLLPTFSAPHSGLLFNASVLKIQLTSADANLHRLIAEHLKGLEHLSADEMPGHIRQLLRNLLPSGRATIERVSDSMAINPRTLQRRLAQEGTSFQQLLDDTRQAMASSYLQTTSLSCWATLTSAHFPERLIAGLESLQSNAKGNWDSTGNLFYSENA